MHISKVLLALAVNASLGSACTFGFSGSRNFNTGDLSGGLSCRIKILRSDENKESKEDKVDLHENIDCGKGCKTVKYYGEEYEFCHNGVGGDVGSMADGATVQRKGGGNKVNIIPDGEDKKDRRQDPFSSTLSHYYWRSNIRC
ncbi:uncharacterized protein BDW47DRAFT_99976 [Aspergillus candidus]|uniref:Uncharacterized protein n=1 Tax=Aspergillus candidus TaxID=41067 RepID=A0A2I2FL32_ASPCN|nr:hypothetical protein BDW47DRAFT_99976 [Aspergillus candidus]PLB41348.1 hypothetical protein BDW47DRAFT_99976 [Aspergillus candidus]